MVREDAAHPSLRKPVPVERRNIERSDPDRPRMLDEGLSVAIADGPVQSTDRSATDPESRGLQRGPADPNALEGLVWHRGPPGNRPDERSAGDDTVKPMIRIDAHQHFWDIESGRYSWPTAADASIYRTFTPH